MAHAAEKAEPAANSYTQLNFYDIKSLLVICSLQTYSKESEVYRK